MFQPKFLDFGVFQTKFWLLYPKLIKRKFLMAKTIRNQARKKQQKKIANRRNYLNR